MDFWSDVVERLGPKLYRYFCGSVDAATASDLVQETLIRLVNKQQAGAYKAELGSLSAFAFGIARLVRLEHLKLKMPFELSDEAVAAATSAPLDASDPIAHLRWAISQLNPTEQEIVLLLTNSELQLSEIADYLSLPLGTVKSHVHRAKGNLRRLMEVQA